MKKNSGIIAIIIMFILLTTGLNVLLPVINSDAKVVSKFSDESTEWIVTFPGTNAKEIKIPANANVTKATINFTAMSDNGIYPENIELKFGETLPIDWGYQGTGHGAYGFQRYFSDGQVRVNLSYDNPNDPYNETLSFLLPRGADVSDASLELTAFEYDYWEPGITELNRPDSVTWNQDPYPIVFQNRLWVFYRDYNSTQTDESDGDISYNTTTNGITWSGATELTPNGDTPDGYPGGGMDHICGDFHPVPIEFNGDMGVFWGSMSFYNLPANPWGGITNGSDRDIVCRWYDPGTTSWGNYIEITHPTLNANESHYTNNTGDDPDPAGGVIYPWHKDDRRPNVAVFNNKIYCIWTANNTSNMTFRMHGFNESWWNWNQRGDIIVSSSSNGISWSPGLDLTAGDEWTAIDFAPTLCTYDGKLYALWETNGRWWNNSGNWTMKADVQNILDWDIIYRFTSDGENWSDYYELTLQNDTANNVPASDVDHTYPDEDPRMIVFTDPSDNKEKLYCIYRTRNPAITNGTDYDIVYIVSEDGINWTHPVELTDPETNGGFDNKPELTVFNNKLYAVWRREQGERWADNPDGDIVTRHFDGYEWSVRQEISPFDGDGYGRDDFYPNSAEFNGKFYTTWVTRNRGAGWTQGTDADVVIRSMMPSDLPLSSGLYIGDSSFGTWVLPENTQMTDANPSRTLDLKSTVRTLMETEQFVTNNLWLDAFGNEMVRFNLKVQIKEPGRIRLDNLRIWYNSTLSVGDGITYRAQNQVQNPFSTKINDYIAQNQDKADGNGFIPVKFEAWSPTQGKVKIHNIFLNYNLRPTLNLINPDKTYNMVKKNQTAVFTISWLAVDTDSNAKISLYFHQGTFKTYQGTLIVNDLTEDDTSSYTWTFTEKEVPTDEYSIFGIIDDGDTKVYSYAPGTINIFWEKRSLPWITITKPDAQTNVGLDFFRIEWEDSGTEGVEEDDPTIKLYYSEEYCYSISDILANGTQIDINGDDVINDDDFILENTDGRLGEFIWDISEFAEGSSYHISAIINDTYIGETFDCSEFKVTRAYSMPPEDFKLEPGTLIDETNNRWETHSTRPKLSWDVFSANYVFYISVWSGSSSSGTKIFEVQNLTDKSVEINNQGAALQYGNTYYAELYDISYTGAKSQTVSLTFDVVNNIPEMPEIKIVPEKPTSTDPLECLEPSKKVDIDGDYLTYNYKWYFGTSKEHKPEYDNIRTIPADVTTKFDVWTVWVTANDGIDDGVTGEASVEIRNGVPTSIINNPTPAGEYYSNVAINVYGTASDPDDDTMEIYWYLDLPGPVNTTELFWGNAPGNLLKSDVLKFEQKFSTGMHNLTLYVNDGDQETFGSHYTLTFDVLPEKKVKEDSDSTSEFTTTVSISVVVIIVIVLVLVFLFLLIRKRRPKSEREKLYGADKGLKPGEAYVVEDENDNYFGDDLDRKGVDSLAEPPPATTDKSISPGEQKPPMETGASTPPAMDSSSGKQPQLPPPSGDTSATTKK